MNGRSIALAVAMAVLAFIAGMKFTLITQHIEVEAATNTAYVTVAGQVHAYDL